MPAPMRFSIDPDRVVHETIDGEAVIIQLETGTYYSLAGSGAEIWAMLAAGSSTEQVARQLEHRYEAAAEELTAATAALVRELRREELLEDATALGPDEPAANGGGPSSHSPRVPFEPPKLQKYTDMQYFLLLDPIHEVDGTGWPNPSEQTAS